MIPVVGDWVRSYSRGIWQVHRVLADFVDHSPVPPPAPRVLVFSTRFLTAKGSPRIDYESCDASFVNPLEPEARAELESFIERNPLAFRKFQRTEKRCPDLIYNLALSSTPDEVATLANHLGGIIGAGLTLPQIRSIVQASTVGGSVGRNPIRATLQLISKQHEVVDREFVFRRLYVREV